MKIEHRATNMPNGNIVLEQIADRGMHEVREIIMREVFAASERAIQDALIAQGWTPPKGLRPDFDAKREEER